MRLIWSIVICYKTLHGTIMGIVKISHELHDAAKLMAKAMNRSINSQAEFWMRVGKLIEENPSATYKDVLQMLLKQAEQDENQYVSEDI